MFLDVGIFIGISWDFTGFHGIFQGKLPSFPKSWTEIQVVSSLSLLLSLFYYLYFILREYVLVWQLHLGNGNLLTKEVMQLLYVYFLIPFIITFVRHLLSGEIGHK
jgi:hypothetical protein